MAGMHAYIYIYIYIYIVCVCMCVYFQQIVKFSLFPSFIIFHVFQKFFSRSQHMFISNFTWAIFNFIKLHNGTFGSTYITST